MHAGEVCNREVIVSLTDLLGSLAEELSSLSRVEPREQAREARVRK